MPTCPPTAERFAAALEKSKADLRGLVPQFCDLLREILELRQALQVLPAPYAALDRELAALVPADFLRATPYAQLTQFPRYLKAMRVRAERARKHPAKDAERAALLAPYVAAAAKNRDRTGGETFRWLVEEFRVSLFAQELGTAEPVSAKKLDRALAEISAAATGAAAPAARVAPAAKPIVTAPIAIRKRTPLKNLGALGDLFPQ